MDISPALLAEFGVSVLDATANFIVSEYVVTNRETGNPVSGEELIFATRAQFIAELDNAETKL